MDESKTKLLIACPSTLSFLGLSQLISRQKDFTIIKKTTTLKELFFFLNKEAPHIILISSLQLLEAGIDMITRIKDLRESAKIVIFDSTFTANQELMLVRDGVLGIIDADAEPEAFIGALKKVQRGKFWIKRELIRPLVDSFVDTKNSKITNSPIDGLTKRENEILSLIAAGHKNQEISSKLYISELTVKTHINNIYKKLGITSRMEAILYSKKNLELSSNALSID
ncbi:MAG: response regulator transcription factor [Deltaproteobacteria bacterium]|nr:response regulator transcription factor [Deltaproteobacteria bacterium]